MSSTEALSWAITGIVVIVLVAFILYIVGMRSIPVDKRPITPVYDRLGEEVGVAENPDYHVNPGEEKVEKPGTPSGETLQGSGHEPGD